MEMAAPHAKRRRDTPVKQGPAEVAIPSSHEISPPSAAASPTKPTSKPEESLGQVPPLVAGGGEEEGFDRISSLPDAVLGEIISLLPTKEGARTQVLASRWRHLWRSAPLNLDHRGLAGANHSQEDFAGLISKILAAHPGPGRRFSISVGQLLLCPARVDSWLRCPALDNLQELEFVFFWAEPVALPAPTFRFSATLQVLTLSTCILDSAFESLRFPQLRQLGLETVCVSDAALNSLIDGCSVLECLLLNKSYGFSHIRINSPSLISTCIRLTSKPVELIIEDASLLERLLLHDFGNDYLNVTIISAPKLETLGVLSDRRRLSKLKFGTAVIQALHVSFTTVVCSVKILALNNCKLDLDMIIILMRFFPYLEKLYIKTSDMSGNNNSWRRKHRDLVKCLDIHLKTVVLRNYRGTKSHANFATFFILNAKMLELMRFEGSYKDNKKFIAEQHMLLQLDKKASRGAKFQFTCRSYHDLINVNYVQDLSKHNPFECTCCNRDSCVSL